ncbi:LacI family DNA-binding transcriptional regulator [Pseudoxanthomonas sp. JBR18]|uniref:LacI family DNA-binding transcriptional regulator n=1 Tax=Pseudoxanthomonas sp. JBR18 TaxID=2969308 RepID=UPI0023060A55|nr:LacI family DNA-binding transcriptional regulator [Pseudoxanthomonas sp. JBR18]WCE06156.1 LacI family DNA-binding transcriptional regulator [Pseudoxanthomonas sp. JBR18]
MSAEGRRRTKRAPRFTEIAIEAGVSPSTVDRVLNERGSVSDALRRKVVDAAKRLGTNRMLPSVRHGVLHFDVILVHSDVPHFQRINRALERYASLIGPRVTVHRSAWGERDDERLAAFLEHPPYPRHGLLIVARDSDRIRRALQVVNAAGTPVVTLSTDITGVRRLAYTGIDNTLAGRTAGYLIGRFTRQAGKVWIPVTSLDFRAHTERVEGFNQILAEQFPHLDPLPPVEMFDDVERAYAQLHDALRQHHDIVAVYNTGSASAGIRRALRRHPLAVAPVWVGHEATREHAELLNAGDMAATLDQDPESQVLAGLQHLMHANEELEQAPEGLTRFRVVTPANLDQYTLVI